MPFDSKLIQPDDAPLREDGELDLPSDMLALATQLSDDAGHLATCYPGSRNSHVDLAAELVESASRIKGRSRRWTIALVGAGLASIAGVAALAALAPSLLWPGNTEHAESAPFAAHTNNEHSAALADVPTTEAASLQFHSPSLSLGELSGPEMEALFDLLQHDTRRGGSVSF